MKMSLSYFGFIFITVFFCNPEKTLAFGSPLGALSNYSTCTSLDASWTPQWGSLVSYYPFNNSATDSKGSNNLSLNNGAGYTGSDGLACRHSVQRIFPICLGGFSV